MPDYIVKVRNKNGSSEDVSYFAENRTELFKKLEEDGISVVKIRENNKKNNISTIKNRSLLNKALVIITISISIILLIIFSKLYFSKEDISTPVKSQKTQKAEVKKENNKIKHFTKKEVPVETHIKTPPQRPIRYWERENTNGMTEAQIRKWKFKRLPPPSYTNDAMLLREKPKFEIFGTRAENEVAMLMTIVPGEGLVGSPQYDESFKREFLKSYETPIVIHEDDSDYNKQLKRDMIEVKKELLARINAGEDICQIMTETRKEAMRLGLIRQQVNDETIKILKEVKTPKELDHALKVANDLLEKEGIAPIELSPMLRYNMLRKIQK